ncbi:MAG: radical SAM family heme chaperone HemW [Deltaproteobacteria bacterium]|nr:radical SAM family heme chaperone HemW [Deltaproteobacteria bacterium]
MLKTSGRQKKDTLGIYVHIPFCKRKCPYCDFNSVAAVGDGWIAVGTPEKEYAESVLMEFSSIAEREGLGERIRAVETLYFGGGTPSIFSPDTIARIIGGIRRVIPLSDNAEITLEVNPETVDGKKLRGFRDAGINRLSIGIQSLNPTELKTLGRLHSAEKAVEAVALSRDAGFKNIGVDIMFAVPGQTFRGWEKTLIEITGLAPEHVSIYGLTVEKGTPYHGLLKKGELVLPSEGLYADMYRCGARVMKENGYARYEISNFALDGFECRHNMRYWLGKDYIGLGAGAHSYLGLSGQGLRWWNEPSPGRYMEMAGKGLSPSAGSETLKVEEEATERIMLGLRLKEGIRENEFIERFGSPPAEFILRWKELNELGLIRAEDGFIALTQKGILFSNEVF